MQVRQDISNTPGSGKILVYGTPLATPRHEIPLSLLPTTSTNLSTTVPTTGTCGETEDVFASFFSQNIASGSGMIDNLTGGHSTTTTPSYGVDTRSKAHGLTLTNTHGQSSILGAGLDHALYSTTPNW